MNLETLDFSHRSLSLMFCESCFLISEGTCMILHRAGSFSGYLCNVECYTQGEIPFFSGRCWVIFLFSGCHSSGEVVLDWTWTGALLFSVTTITAIGYGTIAPKTTTGRIICIFYSIFGLPITMLCIANIGIWFAQQVCTRMKEERLHVCTSLCLLYNNY